MSVQFRCPGCRKLLAVPDEAAGKQARCPACGTITPLPPRGDTAPAAVAAPQAATVGPGGHSPAALRAYARSRVAGPAQGLAIFGALQCALALVELLQILAHAGRPIPMLGAPAILLPGWLAIDQPLVELILGGFIVAGATKMVRLENRPLVLAALFLAMLPCTSCCCLIGLPLGIWALAALRDPLVQATFDG